MSVNPDAIYAIQPVCGFYPLAWPAQNNTTAWRSWQLRLVDLARLYGINAELYLLRYLTLTLPSVKYFTNFLVPERASLCWSTSWTPVGRSVNWVGLSRSFSTRIVALVSTFLQRFLVQVPTLKWVIAIFCQHIWYRNLEVSLLGAPSYDNIVQNLLPEVPKLSFDFGTSRGTNQKMQLKTVPTIINFRYIRLVFSR